MIKALGLVHVPIVDILAPFLYVFTLNKSIQTVDPSNCDVSGGDISLFGAIFPKKLQL